MHGKRGFNKSELFFENVLSQLEDYICIWNRDKQCVYANDKLEKLWGLKREQYMWKTPTGLGFSPDGSRLFEGNVGRVCESGHPIRGSFPYVRDAGSPRHYECIFNPVRDERGNVEFVACVTRDITERTLAGEALRQSERQFQLLFEAIDEAFCLLEVIYDEEGEPDEFRALKVNPAFEQQTGLKDVVGRTAREVVPNLEEKWLEAWKKVAKTGEPLCFVEESQALGRWFDACIYAAEGKNSSRLVVLFYDITPFVY